MRGSANQRKRPSDFTSHSHRPKTRKTQSSENTTRRLEENNRANLTKLSEKNYKGSFKITIRKYSEISPIFESHSIVEIWSINLDIQTIFSSTFLSPQFFIFFTLLLSAEYAEFDYLLSSLLI